MFKKFIGDKKFYKMALLIAVPIMIQNGITNFVSLLDNLMVGRIGTEQMSGVAITNQLMFVYYLTIFGAISGASIFGAQFYGQGDKEGVRHTFLFKLLISLILTVIALGVFTAAGEKLIYLYLHEDATNLDIDKTLEFGKEYLKYALIGLVPYVISQCYAGTLRDCSETKLPMAASTIAVFVNLVLNYILIFGKFGAPVLGVAGAAIATVISRFAELFIILFFVHVRKKETGYRNVFSGVYRSLKIPGNLMLKITIIGLPLLVNEALWAAGKAFINQCYSMRGLEVVAAMNISTTIENLFNIFFMAMGSAVAIIVGQLLGAGKAEEAIDQDRKLIFFSVVSCFLIGFVLILVSPFIPRLYNTEPVVQKLATQLIAISAVFMPLNAFNHAAYFTMRSGGKTFVTFLFDSVYVWVVNIPLAYVLAYHTGLPIQIMFFCCLGIDFVKCVVGFVMIKKRVWVNNIITKKDGKE